MDPDLDLVLERGQKPLHAAIAEQVATAIGEGRLTPGERLPPERHLAESLGVSRMTVRQALGELERDGLLRRVVGRAGGTFVCEPKVERDPAASGGLSAELRRQGLAAGAELISVEVGAAGRRAAAALGLGRGGPVVVIVRLRLAGGRPLAVERSSLPARLFPDLEDMDLGGSLYDLMDEGFGLRPGQSGRAAGDDGGATVRCAIARVKRGAPMLLVERIAYAADGTPVEFARDRFRGDRTRIVVESPQVGE